MMMRTVLIHASWSPGEIRIAVMADGALVDYGIWRPGSPDGVADLYRGRITAVVPSMAGAFVTLRGGMPGSAEGVEGFLPDSEGAKGVREGAIMVVRITRAAQGGKGPRLTGRVERVDNLPEDSGLGLLRRGIDPLREIAARYPEAAVLVNDPALAASMRADLGQRLVRVAQAFDDAIETEVAALASPEVSFASGVRLSVCPTPALVAIDVDGGEALAGTEPAARRHLALNVGVLREVARQIRLRNLSGAILVDLAGLKARQRKSLGPALADALVGDPMRSRFLGFTALGLAEISRRRVRAPLHETLMGPLASGLVALRAIARASRAEPGKRLTLRAAPTVIAALEADPVALPDLARVTGQRLKSRSDPSLVGDGWQIEAFDG